MTHTLAASRPPNKASLDEPSLDVMRRAFAQTYRSGLDPRITLSFDRSTIEQHDMPGGKGLYYVVVRATDPLLPPQDVYRLYPDLRIVALRRNYPPAIKQEFARMERARK